VKALLRAGAGLGAVAHVAALLGSDLAWMAPVPSWLTAQIPVLFLVILMITWLKRDWVWNPLFEPDWRQRGWRWPTEWSPWVRRLYFGLWGYAPFQGLLGCGSIVFSSGAPAGTSQPTRSLFIPGLTAVWVVFYATVLLLASIWLKLRDDTRLDWPSDPAP
jgi:hypothetical protein